MKDKMIKAVKLQLHTGLEGFNSPESFGVYRNTGGEPLGVVGRVYEPPDLHLFHDVIEQSIRECGVNLDLSKLEYSEMKGGAKVRISIPGPTIEVKTKMKGDVIGTRIDFNTGFDGLTKTSLSYFVRRVWCDNGAARWDNDISLNFKNTPGNQGKWLLFCDELFTVLGDTVKYGELLSKAATITYTTAQRNAFFTKVLGYSEADQELTTRKRNILDKINASVAIEERNTGANLFGLLQGFTRYTSHDLANGDMDALLFDNPAKINKDAHRALIAVMS